MNKWKKAEKIYINRYGWHLQCLETDDDLVYYVRFENERAIKIATYKLNNHDLVLHKDLPSNVYEIIQKGIRRRQDEDFN